MYTEKRKAQTRGRKAPEDEKGSRQEGKRKRAVMRNVGTTELQEPRRDTG